jgi:hypothetical protein
MRRLTLLRIGTVLLTGAALGGMAFADDKDFTNDTMETRVTSPPPNIMFVLDNSGSMDWSFMAPEDDGLFKGDRYIWSPGDNVYSGSLSEELEWKRQWAGYNRIYYNPQSSYVPWPRWNQSANTEGRDGDLIKEGGSYPAFNADLKTPRSNPIDRDRTLNLHGDYVEIKSVNAVVVDDGDGSPSYTDTGFSSSSSYGPHWNSGYHYTGNNRTATFTPELSAGKYTVWGYWPCATNRDTNVKIQLDINGTKYTERRSQRASSNNTPKSGYCGEWIPLFGKTLYTMPEGALTSLSIIRDNSSTGSYTQADAIAFLPEGETEVKTEAVHVKNAHYYTVDDKNGDGEAQEGEVYLVNFIWTDRDGDDTVEEGEVLRHYYLVSYDDDSNNHEDVTSLGEVEYDPSAEYDANGDGVADNADDVPDTIQPVTYNDDLQKYVFMTDLEELQNFANWFSFYRRRELTAKAAVSRTIAGLSNVYVGYNTMHREAGGGGAKQPVLPIDVYESVYTGSDIIVDNKDNGFTKSNSWSESGSKPEWRNSSLYTSNSGK